MASNATGAPAVGSAQQNQATSTNDLGSAAKCKVTRSAGGGSAVSKATENYECQFFYEDEVFKVDHKGHVRFGVITQTAEPYSSDEDEDEPLDSVSQGHVRVAFYHDERETTLAESSIVLADRALMPGDVVRRRLPGQKNLVGQSGYVRDVSMRADVKVLDSKYVIKNVPSERLRPITKWAPGDPVCLGTWIGTMTDVDESAIIRTSNGARLQISSQYFHKFKDANGFSSRNVFNYSVFYPGNVIIGRLPPMERLTNLTPEISYQAGRKGRCRYTVESLKTTAVNVTWTCRTMSQANDQAAEKDPLKHPSNEISCENLENVKQLNIYDSCVLQIHDRFYLKYSNCDKLVKYTTWEDEQSAIFQPIFERQQNGNKAIETKETAPPERSDTPTPIASTSRTPRGIAKRSRHNKSVRLNRSQVDELNTSKQSTTSTVTKASEANEETWDSVDDTEYESEALLEQQEDLCVTPGTVELTPDESLPKVNECEVPMCSLSYVPRMRINKRKKKRFSRTAKKPLQSPFLKKETDPKDGDELVVEILVVYSTVTVVWQDGTVETAIPSTQLYPIHHLDNHEFFPGDFVSKANEPNSSQTEYGVIQKVDHDARIAKVRWFKIYSNADNPVPLAKNFEELSVYDLKDHADYQYRPGTLVIRVSNFTGDNINSTAGQVIDNFIDGRVRVWWVGGHITMCYPQDLFEIYHHTDEDLDDNDSEGSGDSWETQSENSRIAADLNLMLTTNYEDIISGIDTARKAMKILEKIFNILPKERKTEALSDLLVVYKNGRYLDSLLHTDYFHEDNFQGILQRKTKADVENSSDAEGNAKAGNYESVGAVENKEDLQAQILQTNATPTKRKSSTVIEEVQRKRCYDLVSEKPNEYLEESMHLENDEPPSTEMQLTDSQLLDKYRMEYEEMQEKARSSIAKCFDKRKHQKNDSGIFTRGENSSCEVNFASESKEETVANVDEDNLTSVSKTSIELRESCNVDNFEVFYFLIYEQLTKCREVVWSSLDAIKNQNADISDAEEATEQDMNELVLDIVDNVMSTTEHPLNLNVLSESLPPLESPVACSSPSPTKISNRPTSVKAHCFEVLPNAPPFHSFYDTIIQPSNQAQYQRAVQREYRMLQSSLPDGVHVRAYEDRMDLMSVMMVGPKNTPYENALFFFDFQLGRDYPKSPPTCHYISFCTERLNPNLYEEGKVCVSLLGTWTGRDTEVWTKESTMLQVLVSIQGLILVDEPYFNEAGYEKQRGTQLGRENSRVYNEMALIKIVHSTIKQLLNPPLIFRNNLREHFKEFGTEVYERIKSWAEFSEEAERRKITKVQDMPDEYKNNFNIPEFSLLPCSRGFCIAAKKALESFKKELDILNEPESCKEESNDSNNVAESEQLAVNKAPRAAPEEV